MSDEAEPSNSQATGRAAVVAAGVVVNVILIPLNADGTPNFVVEDADVYVLPNNSPVSADWLYFDGEYTAPDPD